MTTSDAYRNLAFRFCAGNINRPAKHATMTATQGYVQSYEHVIAIRIDPVNDKDGGKIILFDCHASVTTRKHVRALAPFADFIKDCAEHPCGSNGCLVKAAHRQAVQAASA